ncbi:MAG: DUF502 domain-containing protein [Candidatus Riflebacteria bacterium]|nr:DUF502 domain-containing protein [Candidatus Riflebacteria bacterium]
MKQTEPSPLDNGGRWNAVVAILLDSLEALANRARTYFLTGVILLVPAVVTIFIFFQLFLFADGLLGESVSRAIGFRLPGIGLIVTFLLFMAAGVIGQNVLGKRLWRWVEYSLETLPVVRSLYVGVKQVSDVLFQQRKSDFQRVVLVEYPRRELWVIGFVTNDHAIWSTDSRIGDRQMVSVFIPTTPNPTSGFLILIDRTQVIDTGMSIEEAMKLVISGGLVQSPISPVPQEALDEFTIPH